VWPEEQYVLTSVLERLFQVLYNEASRWVKSVNKETNLDVASVVL
jgi:hypothetical protein